MVSRLFRPICLSVMTLSLSAALACGGGGGGGGGGGRTTDTAVRLVHAAVALAPLDVFVQTDNEELLLQRARYAEPTDYVRVDKGQKSVRLQRANSAGAAYRTVPIEFAEDTEYTIFLYGGRNVQTDGVAVITEPVERPEEGFARVQLLNGFESSSALTLTASGLGSSVSAGYGSSSGFATIPSGLQEFVIRIGGSEFARLSLEVPDRGEVTLVASGSSSLGYRKVIAYNDLD